MKRHTIGAQRALMTAEIDADLLWRQTRSEKFLVLIANDNISHPRAWKDLDADTELLELERQTRHAAADARVGWWKLTEIRRNQDRRGSWAWWTTRMPTSVAYSEESQS